MRLLLICAVCLLSSCATTSTSVAAQSCVIEDCEIAAVHSHTSYWANY